MNMTTEKLAELQSRIDHAFEERLGVQRAITFAELQALISLAERALQPEEGQASDMEAFAKWKAYPLPPLNADGQFAPDSLHREWRAFCAGRASQLALPAGPVPEGRSAIALCDEYGSAVTAFTTEEVQAVRHAALEEAAKVCEQRRHTAWSPGLAAAIRALKFSPSPAVAQPDELAKLKDPHAVHVNMLRGTIAKIGMRELAHVHGEEMSARWQRFEEWEASQAAVAQPVAHERARFEAWASEPFRSEKMPLEMHPNGAYKDTRSYLIWYGWKARAALCQPAEGGV